MSNLYVRSPSNIIRMLLCLVLLCAQLSSTQRSTLAKECPEPSGIAVVQSSGLLPLVPVVFVPGTAGSELRLQTAAHEDKLYWLGPPTFENKAMTRAEMNPSGNDLPGITVRVGEPLAAIKPPFMGPRLVYGNFLAWARAVFRESFYVAPYDWRKGAGNESAERLDAVINQALKNSKQKKVILVAHSLGGLVSRDYIVRKGSGKVAALIAVGTPWLGLPKTVRALEWGYNFEAGTVETSKDRPSLKGLPEGYTSSRCGNEEKKKDNDKGKNKVKCDRVERVSFLNLGDVRKLASSFRAVFQQLPTEAFMREYGRATSSREENGSDFKSILWGRNSWEKMEKFYLSKNKILFDETQAWRKCTFDRRDFGVKHYLIGGIYSPDCRNSKNKDCDIGNRMDMQMADATQVSISNLSRGYSALVAAGNILLSPFKLRAHRDPFVALDSDYEWGDGTTPLLSATAGEYVRDERKPVNPGMAEGYLGPNTETQAVVLGPKYGHSAMLDDPKVRKLLVSFYKTESLKLGAAPIFPEQIAEVTSLMIKIATEDNGIKNAIKTRIEELADSKILTSKETVAFTKLKIKDSEYFLPKQKPSDKNVRVVRALLTSDVPNLTLSVRNDGNQGRTLKITTIEVFVNGSRSIGVFEGLAPFDLPPRTERTIRFSEPHE